MKDQHEKIKGYRDLSQQEIDLMNEAKELGEKVGDLVKRLEEYSVQGYNNEYLIDDFGPDSGWIYRAEEKLQIGFMCLLRAIAQPTTF